MSLRASPRLAANRVINPSAAELGRRNAIFWGRGRNRYHVENFPGPLSIKAVIRGEAVWETESGRFPVDAHSYLLLNDSQVYSLNIDSTSPVETFCIFFERGFVEDAWRSMTTPPRALLDDPFNPAMIGFFERLRPQDTVSSVLTAMHRRVLSGEDSDAAFEDQFHALAVRLLSVHANLSGERARLPAVRASTREELYRRLLRARQFLDDGAAARLSLAQVARSAALSPFHFHRLFTAVFRQTPHQYVSQKRLQRAARLLHETGMPVTDVCLETGFESLGSFSTLFRRRFGMPPSAYRNSKIREARRAASIAS
jgi:AraC-like DNA-binding protein